MARLQTGAFDLRRLPTLQEIDASDFGGAPQAALAGFGGALRQLGSIEELRTAQRAGEIEKATQGDRRRLAEMRVRGDVEALPELQQIEGLKRGEIIEEFPAQRGRRSAETTEGTERATTGTEAQRQKRAGLEATREENVRIAQTGAEAERLKNQTAADQERAAGFAARYSTEPQLTHIIEDPTGQYRETYVDMGDRKIVLRREQLATAEELAGKRAQSAATTEATKALAEQRRRLPQGKAPMAVRDRHGATKGYVHPVIDRDSGEILDWEYKPVEETVTSTAPRVTPAATVPTTTPAAAPAAASASLPVLTPEQAAAAPSGTRFKSPDGRIYRKP